MKFLILTMLALATAERFSYEGYKVYDVTCVNTEQKEFIRTLTASHPEIDVWNHNPRIDEVSRMMVEPARDSWFRTILEEHSIAYSVSEHNFEASIQRDLKRKGMPFDLNDYNDLETIMNEMDLMAQDCRNLGLDCSVREVGYTYEGRPMKVLVVMTTDQSSPFPNGKPGIWMDATIHAREWVATMTNVNFMDKISRYYGIDDEVTSMVNMFNWYFMPVLNADGYDFSWTDTRNWRKNRAPNQGSVCVGTDLNRNFDYDWNTVGSSDNPCAGDYHGDAAASEPETQVIQTVSAELNVNENVIAWVSAHTYGNYWLHSFGGSDDGTVTGNCKRSDAHDDLYQVAEETAIAIMAVYDTTWTYGTICEAIYPAAGGTVDYIHGTSHVKYSYTPELRGNSFDPPPSEIAFAFEEFWTGVRQMVFSIDGIEH